MSAIPAIIRRLIASSGALLAALHRCSIVVAIAGGAAAGSSPGAAWRADARQAARAHTAQSTGEGRDRFLALWGMMSSLWFFCAILFNAIASVMVPLCLG